MREVEVVEMHVGDCAGREEAERERGVGHWR